VDSDAPTIHAFLQLHAAMLEERRKPRDVAAIYSIPAAPVPPMAFGQRMVEMVESGWYHVLSGGVGGGCVETLGSVHAACFPYLMAPHAHAHAHTPHSPKA
jgi:hypothetical protein